MKERSDMTSDDKPIIGNEIVFKKFNKKDETDSKR
jgi:hypothetical protein